MNVILWNRLGFTGSRFLNSNYNSNIFCRWRNLKGRFVFISLHDMFHVIRKLENNEGIIILLN